MVRVKRNGTEGTVSALVTDTTKHKCWYCGGTRFMYPTTIDDFNDVGEDINAVAYLVTITGGSIQAEVLLCDTCGQQNIGNWYITDTSATTAAAHTMTNLDASSANGLAGVYMFPCVGTDIGKYFIVASNTAASPTVITTTVAANNDSDGIWVITRFLPVGLTVAT